MAKMSKINGNFNRMPNFCQMIWRLPDMGENYLYFSEEVAEEKKSGKNSN